MRKNSNAKYDREYCEEEYTLEEAEYLEKMGNQIEALESELASLRLDVSGPPVPHSLVTFKSIQNWESTIPNNFDSLLPSDSALKDDSCDPKKTKEGSLNQTHQHQLSHSPPEALILQEEITVFQEKCAALENQLDELQEAVGEIESLKSQMSDLEKIKNEITKEFLKVKEVIVALRSSKKKEATNHQREMEKLRGENAVLKERVAFLEERLKKKEKMTEREMAEEKEMENQQRESKNGPMYVDFVSQVQEMRLSNCEIDREHETIKGLFLHKFGFQEHLGFSVGPKLTKLPKKSQAISVSLLILEGFPDSNYTAELSLGPSEELVYSVQDAVNEERTHLGRNVLKEFSLELETLEKLKDVRICIMEKRKEWEVPYSDISIGHGWKGVMDYQAAKAGLRDVRTDDSTKSIFFDLGDHAILQSRILDSSSDYFLYTKEANNEPNGAYMADMTQVGSDSKRSFKVFSKPIELLEGVRCLSQVKIDKLVHPFSHKKLILRLFTKKNTVLVAPLLELGLGSMKIF